MVIAVISIKSWQKKSWNRYSTKSRDFRFVLHKLAIYDKTTVQLVLILI